MKGLIKIRIRIVNSKENIGKLDKDEKFVHLTFRPSSTDVFSIVKRSPNLKAIQIPNSYTKTMAKSIRMFLDMQNIELLEGDVWGHRTDISNYSEVSQIVYDSIKNYKKRGLSDDEIHDKLLKETKLDSSIIKFLISQ